MKKTLALVLSILMIFCLIPGTAFAQTQDSKTDLSTGTLTFDQKEYAYTGSGVHPQITIKIGSSTITDVQNGAGYDVSYSSDGKTYTGTAPTEVGKIHVKVTATDKNNTYTGSLTETFQIKYDLAHAEIDSLPDKTYTGSKIVISSVTATYPKSQSTNITIPASEYTITNGENMNAGDKAGQVTIQAKPSSESYMGRKTATFKIKKLEVDPGHLLIYIPSQSISTATKLDDVQVTYKGIPLTETDYAVSGVNRKQAGTYNATFAIDQSSKNFVQKKDTSGIKVSYTVVEKSSDNNKLNYYVDVTPRTYTGYEQTPYVYITDNGRVLTSGRDYKIICPNNKDAGYKKLTIEGINFAGSKDYYFYILPAQFSDCSLSIPADSYKYTGSEIKPKVTVKLGNTILPETDYEVRYASNVNTGTASVTVTPKSANLTGLSKTLYFTIKGTALNDCVVSLSQSNYTYTGYECRPVVTIRDGYKTLIKGVNYSIKYENNVKAGTAKIILTGLGGYSGTVTKEFSILGKSNTVTTNYTNYTKYIGSASFNLGAKSNGDGYGFKYTTDTPSVATVSTSGTVSVIGTGLAKIKVETVGTSAYNPAYKYVYITVKPKKPPFNVDAISKGKIKVTITKVEGATKYQVRYGRMGKYYNRYIAHKDNGTPIVSTTIGNRKSKTNYFIKVRSYKTLSDGTKVWGNWTIIRKIKTK